MSTDEQAASAPGDEHGPAEGVRGGRWGRLGDEGVWRVVGTFRPVRGI
jgi:hypothetical protein